MPGVKVGARFIAHDERWLANPHISHHRIGAVLVIPVVVFGSVGVYAVFYGVSWGWGEKPQRGPLGPGERAEWPARSTPLCSELLFTCAGRAVQILSRS